MKDILSERSADGELNYEQGLAFDYAKKFSKVSIADGEKMLAELKKIGGMTDSLAISIVNILPADKDIVALLVPKGVNLEAGAVEKIVDLSLKNTK